MESDLIMAKRGPWLAGLLLIVVFAVLAPSSVHASSLLIDNGDTGYAETGKWTTSGLAGQYGANSRYAPSGSGSSKARWTPMIASAGNYDVYIWYPAYSNRATDAPFRVVHSGGSAVYPVNQTLNGAQWVYLDTLAFASGSSGYVELSNNANGYVSADAVVFVPEGESPPSHKSSRLPVRITPDYLYTQTLFDADPTGIDKYLAFPTLMKIDDSRVVVSYKRGDAHYMESEASLETMIYNPSSGTVASRTTTDQTSGVINQNPELMRMPDGTLYNYVDQQIGGTKTRMGVRVFKSTDDGSSFTDEGAFPQVGSYSYGYFFDDYNDDGTVYMLAMSFPELTGGQRAVHVIKTTDNGATWSYVKNLNTEFAFAFNESSIEKVDGGFIIIARGDNQVTRIFKTDESFNLVAQQNWTSSYSAINYIGRPKLFTADGNYYLLSRNIEGSTTHLVIYKLNPDTLELETYTILDSNTFSAADSYYAEPYFITKAGTTYIQVITYQKASSADLPNIVLYELVWDELQALLHEDFDGMSDGLPPAGWLIGTAGGSVIVEQWPLDSEKSLKLTDSSSSELVEARRAFSSAADRVTLQYNARMRQTNGVFGVSLRNALGVNGVTVAFDSNGTIYSYNGAAKTVIQAGYSADQWYSVKIIADIAAQTCDIYVDDVRLADDFVFRGAVAELSEVRINSTGAAQGTAVWDDIMVY